MKQTRLLNNIVGGSYEADERIAGCSVSQNLYAESVEELPNGSYYTTALRSVDGEKVVIENVATIDEVSQGCRGMFTASDDSIFAAFGNNVVRIKKNSITGAYSREVIYTETSATIEKVCFCETGGINSHVCWVNSTSGVFAYPLEPDKAEAMGVTYPLRFVSPLRVYLTSDEIKKATNVHVKPNSICSLNGSLIINDPETDTWYYTEAYILGGTTYKREIYELDSEGNIQYETGSAYKVKTTEVDLSAEDQSSGTSYLWLDRYSKPHFTTAEYSADRLAGMCVCGSFLMAFGTRSIQMYSQSTSTDAQGFSSLVFTSSGRNISDLGCRYADTIKIVNGNAVFLASSVRGEHSVWATNGGAPTRISTNAIERELEGVELKGAYAFSYSDNGHHFYCMNVPNLDKTLVFDFTTNQWHNRTTLDENGRMGKWWACYAENAGGDVVIGGAGVNKLVILDKDKFDDYLGNPIVKRRTAPILISDFSPFIVNDIMLMWNTGTTTDVTNEAGAKNPVVMLEVSTDGGNTYGSERWAYGGRVGQYGVRTMWRGIGAGNYFVFRFTISDRVRVVITGAKITHTKLNRF